MLKWLAGESVSSMMNAEARLLLKSAVADLREITARLDRILLTADDSTRANLLEIRAQSEAAMRYYSFVLNRSTPMAKVPPVVQRAATAALGLDGVGLVPAFKRS